MYRAARTPIVYFVTARSLSMVRIGRSDCASARLQVLASMSPVPLKLEATTPGGPVCESWYHVRHRRHHSHSDWYHLTPAIEHDIAIIRRDGKRRGQPDRVLEDLCIDGENVDRLCKVLSIKPSELAAALGGNSYAATRQLLLRGFDGLRIARFWGLMNERQPGLDINNLPAMFERWGVTATSRGRAA